MIRTYRSQVCIRDKKSLFDVVKKQYIKCTCEVDLQDDMLVITYKDLFNEDGRCYDYEIFVDYNNIFLLDISDEYEAVGIGVEHKCKTVKRFLDNDEIQGSKSTSDTDIYVFDGQQERKDLYHSINNLLKTKGIEV